MTTLELYKRIGCKPHFEGVVALLLSNQDMRDSNCFNEQFKSYKSQVILYLFT